MQDLTRIIGSLVIIAVVIFFLGSSMRPSPTNIPSPQNPSAAPAPVVSFDYYTLVLSWSPEYCAESAAHENTMQCSERSYGFVLHGLWPEYTKGWPQNCVGDTALSTQQVSSMLDIMPSTDLVRHEYAKHGTCSGLGADRYFALARRLFVSIRVPSEYEQLHRELTVSPEEISRAFLAANSQITADELFVACTRSGQLQDVRICFTPSGVPGPCGKNESASLCKSPTVTMPPMK